jgi:hypothetical protein
MIVKEEHPMTTEHTHSTASDIRFSWFVHLSILTVVTILLWAAAAMAAPGGRILIAGYGPELPIIQDLAKAYEKGHLGTAIFIDGIRPCGLGLCLKIKGNR